MRRGRVFQTDDKGQELAAGSLADVSATAVAVLHPALVANALRENRHNLRVDSPGTHLFACNDALWTVAIDAKAARIKGLKHRVFSEVYGDGEEEVVLGRGGRETARFDFGAPEPVDAVDIPSGDSRRDRGHAIDAREITFSELAPHLFTIDLASLSTRVIVAEFDDHLVVIEGAYNRARDLQRGLGAHGRVLRLLVSRPEDPADRPIEAGLSHRR